MPARPLSALRFLSATCGSIPEPGTRLALPRGRWLCECGPQGSWAGLGPKRAAEESPDRVFRPSLPFSKITSIKSKCHPRQVPGALRPLPHAVALPTPRQPDAPQFTEPPPTWEPAGPQESIVRGGGEAGGAGGSSGCLLHLMEGSTSQRARGHEWSFLTWLRCPVPQCRAPGPGGKALGVLGMVWGGPCTPAPAASLTEVPSRVSQWPPRIQDPNCCPSRCLSPPGSPHGADPPLKSVSPRNLGDRNRKGSRAALNQVWGEGHGKRGAQSRMCPPRTLPPLPGEAQRQRPARRHGVQLASTSWGEWGCTCSPPWI